MRCVLSFHRVQKMKRGKDTMINNEVFVNRKLWVDTFNALKRHQDLLRDRHDRSQILRFQIDTLYTMHTLLSNTFEACNNKPLHTTYTVLSK